MKIQLRNYKQAQAITNFDLIPSNAITRAKKAFDIIAGKEGKDPAPSKELQSKLIISTNRNKEFQSEFEEVGRKSNFIFLSNGRPNRVTGKTIIKKLLYLWTMF